METKPNEDLSLMELAFCWAQKIMKQSNTQATSDCQDECREEKLDPGTVLEGGRR